MKAEMNNIKTKQKNNRKQRSNQHLANEELSLGHKQKVFQNTHWIRNKTRNPRG